MGYVPDRSKPVNDQIRDCVEAMGGWLFGPGSATLDMTISDTADVDPVFIAATLADGDFTWLAPDGETTFTGKTPAAANFVAGGVGTYRVYCTDWSAVTEFAADDDNVTALDVAVATALTTLVCYGNSLTALNVSANTALTELGCDTNPLTTLDISTNTLLDDLNVATCNLTVAAVDAILAALVAAAVDGGTADLSGQTPAAIPGVQGQLDLATLVAEAPGRAWTITTD